MTAAKKADDKLNVWQRINAVRAELTAVDKDKQVGDGSYAYMVTTHEAIKAVLRPLMAKHGLVDYIEEKEYERVDTGVMRGKSPGQRALIQHQGVYLYIIVNTDDPKDTHSFIVRGDGEDSGDKGPGKATTYALKSGQKILFQIGSDETEEERIADEEISQRESLPVNDFQIDQLMQLADELFDKEANATLKLMANKLFTVADITQLPAIHFEAAMDNLRKKAAGEKKKAEKEATIAEAAANEVDAEPEAEPSKIDSKDNAPPTEEPEESL